MGSGTRPVQTKLLLLYILVRLRFFFTSIKCTNYDERTAIDFFKEYYNCLPFLHTTCFIYLQQNIGKYGVGLSVELDLTDPEQLF